MKREISLLANAVMVLCTFSLAQAGVLVTDLIGKAEADGKKSVTVLSEIADGGLLELAAGAQLVATDLSSGREYVLLGAGQFRVSSSGVEGIAGASVTVRNLPVSKLPTVKLAVARVSQAAVSMRGGAASSDGPDPLSPARVVVLSATPTLRWSAVEGASRYRVTVVDDGDRTVFETETKETELTLPRQAPLGAGKQYAWRVAALGASARIADASTTFSIIADDLAKLLAQIKPDKDSPHSRWVLYAAQLQEAGAVDDARLIWQALAKERPDDANLSRLAR